MKIFCFKNENFSIRIVIVFKMRIFKLKIMLIEFIEIKEG